MFCPRSCLGYVVEKICKSVTWSRYQRSCLPMVKLCAAHFKTDDPLDNVRPVMITLTSRFHAACFIFFFSFCLFICLFLFYVFVLSLHNRPLEPPSPPPPPPPPTRTHTPTPYEKKKRKERTVIRVDNQEVLQGWCKVRFNPDYFRPPPPPPFFFLIELYF